MQDKLEAKLEKQVLQDNAFLVESVTNAWLALLKDAPFLSDSHSETDLRWWRKYFSETPFSVICEVMKAFGNALTMSLSSDPASYKDAYLPWIGRLRIVGGVYIHVLKRISTFDDLTDVERESTAAELQWLFSFFKFGVKAEYVDPRLQTAALGDWKANEKRLSKVRLSRNLTRVLRSVYCALFPKFLNEEVIGKHGSGSVYQKGIRSAYDKLSLDPVLPESILKKYFKKPDHRKIAASEAFAGLMQHIWPHEARMYETWSKGLQGTYPPKRGRISLKTRMMYVAKDVLRMRGVGCEDLSLMFFQQAVSLMFSGMFEGTHIRKYIDLHDQARNGRHALISSRDGMSVTIDNKDASDNILARLAKQIMPAGIWSHVDATRSEYAELIDKTVVKMQKLSPMGSAVTFPVQSSIFLALAVLAYQIHHIWYVYEFEGFGTLHASEGKLDIPYALSAIEKLDPAEMEKWLETYVHASIENRNPSKYMCPNVYGDDVIIDVRTADIFITLCEAVGFVINKTKTHGSESAFRESCGVEAFKGYDITPLYWKHPSGKTRSVPLLKSLIGLANRSFLYGYESLRSHTIKEILYEDYGPGLSYQGITAIRFTNNLEDSSQLWTNNANPNWHLQSRDIDYDITNPATIRKYVRAVKLMADGKELPKRLLNDISHILYQRKETRGFHLVLNNEDKHVVNDDYRYLLTVRKQKPPWKQLRDREKPVYFDYQKVEDFGGNNLKVFAKPSDYSIAYGWAP